ncbi:MAG: glycosyltransferase [Isosphaeraceae bacterium]
MNEPGVVVIGRNEGERLVRCLGTVVGEGRPVVYVDSASSDRSVDAAKALGVDVVALDPSRPLSAARARNEGFARLRALAPERRYVQFVDGDCEVAPGWFGLAVDVMEARPEVAIVCGRLREKFREATIYNRLADMEWDGPPGEVAECGGIFLTRAEVFEAVGGFNAGLVAGEEGEYCLRVVRAGGKVLRLAEPMAWHDMAMTRFRAWWKRSVRAGFAYANGHALDVGSPNRRYARQLRSVILWGAVVPLTAIGLAWPSRGLSLALTLGYVALYFRLMRHGRGRGWSTADARLYALAILLGKFPQALGVARYAVTRLLGRPSTLIEHKGAADA